MRLARMLVGVGFVFCLAQFAFSATFTVTKTADTNDGACDAADCSLREAVAAANATADNDIIVFAPSVFGTPQTITLSGTDIIISNAGTLTITGTGADKLTVSGNNASRVFTNNTGAVTNISNLRVTGGTGTSSVSTGRGGGVYNGGGTLTLLNVIVTGNTATNGGGASNAGTAIFNIINSIISNNTATGAGGGMQNFSGNTLNLINTTFSGNTCNSTLTGGGGIQANGTLTMSNVTFSANTANGGDGGAIYYNGQGLTMNNTTVFNNVATGGGAGGIHKSTTTLNANLRNSIIAGNSGTTSPDAVGAFNSQGNNIIGVVGTSTGWITADLQNVNPLLAPLGYYGGFGLTHATLTGSPAIDAGQNCVVDLTCAAANPPLALTADERGAPRVGTVDIGAYEANSTFTAALPPAVSGQPYNTVIAPNRGSFTYAVTGGALPPGLMLNSATDVVISGTPTQVGTYLFDITVSNGANSTTVTYFITVSGSLANASVGGRVINAAGFGIPNAIVIIANSTGERRVARTNGFGYYRFDNVPTGQDYTVGVTARNYQFSPFIVTVNGNITDLNFTALP